MRVKRLGGWRVSRKCSDWSSEMKRIFLGTCLLLFSCSTFAQRSVTIPVPGATKPIKGDLYGGGTRGVILAHGGRLNRESWHKQAQALVDAGFVVLAIDFRGDTTTDKGTLNSVGSDEDNASDILAGVAYLRAHGATKISAVGASMGGSALAIADAISKPGEFDRIVLLAASADDAASLKGRKLFIVARNDANSSGPRINRISDSYAKAPEPKKLVVLEGSAHAQFLFDTDEGPRLLREILRFLTEP